MFNNLSRRLGGGSALMGLVLATVAVTVPAEAAQAAPSSLSPSGDVSTNTPTLSWNRPSGAVKFEVQVDNDDAFTSPGYSVTTVNTRAVPTSLLSTGDQYLRVRAFSSSGAASSWSSTSFTISGFAAPTPISPVAGDTLEQPQDPPLLTWDGIQGATEYTVQVDKEGDWIGSFEYKTQTTSVVVKDPLEAALVTGTTYHWRVKAKKGTGVESAWSEEATFTVMPLNQVDIVSPDDSPDNEIEDVVLDWDPVPGAQYYELRVATNQDFTNIVETRTKIYGTRYSPPVTYKNNQYYWQVRAVDLSGNPTEWSQVQANFSRVWPDTPQALYPADPSLEVINGDPYFQWSPVQHASQYELQVGSNENFSPDTYETCMVAGTTYTPYAGAIPEADRSTYSVRQDEDCLPMPGGITYWRVRPVDRPQSGSPAWILGLFSETQSFRYNAAAGLSFSPSDGETVAYPTLSWDQIQGAVTYELRIVDRFGTSVVNKATTSATSYTPVNAKMDPAKGPFHWFLTGLDAAKDPMTLTFENTFNLGGTPPDSGQPALTPLSGRAVDGAYNLPPDLSWEPMPGAEYYMLFAGPSGTGTRFGAVSQDALEKKLYFPHVTDTWSWFLTSGKYDWRVQAYSSDDEIIGVSSTATMTIAPIGSAQNTRLAIDGLTLDSGPTCSAKVGQVPDICTDAPSTPVFDWSPVPGASLYMLYVSEDANFTNMVEPLTAVPSTSNTRWAPTLSSLRAALPESQAGDAYYWFVRPCRSLTNCAASPVSQVGKATNKFRKRSPGVATTTPGVPTLPSPASVPEVSSAEVTFSWDDYFDTNQATTWSATGEKSPQAAMQYRIQVSKTPTFSMTASQNLDDILVDQTTYTAFTKMYPEGQLYWRVQAIDAEGNGLSWSDVRTFVKASPAVTLRSPVNGSVGAGSRAFEWEPQAFAGSYQIEVAKNDDKNFSSVNRLFLVTGVKQTAYSWNLPIPPSTKPYWWRVRRVDPSGNVAQWSTPRSFMSQGASPSLLAPADDSFQPPNGPLFTWTDVPGASSYTLEYRRGTSTTTVTTAATAYAPTLALRDSTYTWRVTAKDSNKNIVGASGWRSFVVDAARPFVSTYSPRSSMTRGQNLTVTFSEPVRGVSGTTVRLYLGRTKVRARVTYSSTKRMAVLNPTSYLKRGKTYTMKVSGAIKDAKGNLVVAKSWKVRVK